MPQCMRCDHALKLPRSLHCGRGLPPTEFDWTHWAPVRRRQPLPTFYYHRYFVELLEFVERRYVHVLLDAYVRYLRDFRSTSLDAQRPYVRLANRRRRSG